MMGRISDVLTVAAAATPGQGAGDIDLSFWQIIPFVVGCVGLLALLLLSLLPDGRRLLLKSWHLLRSLMCVEIGLGGLLRLALTTAIPACGVAFLRGMAAGDFDWAIFWTVLGVVVVVGMLGNLLNLSMTFRKLLTPGAGMVFRGERKAGTAAVLMKLNRCLAKAKSCPGDALGLITDILDIVVLHVRDHRGSVKDTRHEVFANLLLEDGTEMVVVARDSLLHQTAYGRKTPSRHPKTLVLCGRAVEAGMAMTTGDLTAERPDAPRNKPYRSIMAIPLFTSDVEPQTYGALSVDSSRPYFFESFRAYHIVNTLENTLQPYCQLITLVLETLVARPRKEILESLLKALEDRGQK